ncbi:hypothetical protein NUBL22008_44910 [Klebsiella pneumoniae]|nr:hypothetical protein NUBL22008_44910 [Klebsiella pneumoniae]SXU57515.1 Transposase [Klebsiella pneumoniae]
MKRYSPERKAAVLAKLLPPYNMTVTALTQQEGISEATLYNWRTQARLAGQDQCHLLGSGFHEVSALGGAEYL